MDSRYLDALAKLVALDVSSGRSVDARKRLVDVIERDPRNTTVLMMTAKVLVAEQQFSRAEQMLRRVIELDPSAVEASALLGQMFLAQKRLPEATREFAAIVERDPRSSAAHTMLGLLYHAQRRVPEAIAHYEKASSTTRPLPQLRTTLPGCWPRTRNSWIGRYNLPRGRRPGCRRTPKSWIRSVGCTFSARCWRWR